ncbi:MAG: hemin receptor [Alphaproteobacteria bacterium]|nr:MAG: hemin receptor [Alphaproteobacteria bacterium]
MLAQEGQRPVPLTRDQVHLIRASYAQISQQAPAYADLFYHRLLHKHPFARAVFPDDLRHQSDVFRSTLDAMVERVDDLAALLPGLAALGRRHVGYGVKPSHYAPVGEVLIDTFAELLGEHFTHHMRQAWEALYEDVSTVMLDESCRSSHGPGSSIQSSQIEPKTA